MLQSISGRKIYIFEVASRTVYWNNCKSCYSDEPIYNYVPQERTQMQKTHKYVYEEYYVLAFSVMPSCRYWWLCGIWIKSCGKTTEHLLFSPILHNIAAMAVHNASICLERDGFNSLVTIYHIIMFFLSCELYYGDGWQHTHKTTCLCCAKNSLHIPINVY